MHATSDATGHAKFAWLSTHQRVFIVPRPYCGYAKTGATREKNATVLKMFRLPFALAFALVCFGNDEIVGLIIPNSRCYVLRLI